MAPKRQGVDHRRRPEWFDWRKYTAARKLDTRGWLDQLSARLTLEKFWWATECKHDEILEFATRGWRKTAEYLWNDIQRFGVLPSPYELPEVYGDLCDWHVVEAPDYTAIRTLTNADVYIELFYEKSRKKILKLIEASNESPWDTETFKPTQGWAGQLFRTTYLSSTHVGVDLNVSDEQLQSDFRCWLTETRRHLGYPKKKNNFSETQFGTWSQFRILAYLDLQFWARSKGFKYTQETMANLLFPDDSRIGEDTIRRTVRKHADLFKNSYAVLKAQVRASRNNL